MIRKIKRRIFLFICFLFLCNQLFASHNRGARIEACFIDGFTFDIKITTHTRTSSINGNQPVLDSVNFGDGTSETFNRISKVDLPGDVSENIYEKTHIYPGFGNYTMYVELINRNAGIKNIPGS